MRLSGNWLAGCAWKMAIETACEMCTMLFQIKAKPGCESVPLELASFWCSDDRRAEFRLNYSYNESSLSPPAALSNVSVILPVTAPVSSMQSTPDGTWSAFLQQSIERSINTGFLVPYVIQTTAKSTRDR